jgi:hypothetical protein
VASVEGVISQIDADSSRRSSMTLSELAELADKKHEGEMIVVEIPITIALDMECSPALGKLKWLRRALAENAADWLLTAHQHHQLAEALEPLVDLDRFRVIERRE